MEKDVSRSSNDEDVLDQFSISRPPFGSYTVKIDMRVVNNIIIDIC